MMGALREGRAFVDLSHWRKVAVTGGDAAEWLNDLVSADVADLPPGRARRSLLLSPTGQVRAEFTVARRSDGFLLLQDPTQPSSVAGLLDRYVLSSDVSVVDRSEDLSLFALPGSAEAPVTPWTEASVPSCLGAGSDLVADAVDHVQVLETLATGRGEATGEELETWRIVNGRPKVGVDVLEQDLPQEAGFEDVVAFGKGCYLGQEAVAKMRNLGHPRRMVVALRAGGPVSAGDPVQVDGREVGRVTSAALVDGRSHLLARVAWDALGASLQAASGVRLEPALALP